MIAWIVYKKVGLAVLRHTWIDFDVIRVVPLLVVGDWRCLRLWLSSIRQLVI